MTDERDLLIQRYLSGSTSPEEMKKIEELLRADRDFGKSMVESSGMDAALKEILAVETEMIRLRKPPRALNLVPALSWIAAAAILVLVIWIGTKFSPAPKVAVEPIPPPIVEPPLRPVDPIRKAEKTPEPTPPPEDFKPPEMPPDEPKPDPKPEPPVPPTPPSQKRIESAVAVAEIEEYKGTVTVKSSPAVRGLAILADQDIVVGWKSFAILKFGDGTTIRLGANTTLVVGSEFELRSGTIHVDTKKPLQIQTPTSRVAVLGTRFDVTVRPEGTHVAVAEGRVRLTNNEGRSIELPAGTFASSADLKPMRELSKMLEDHERSMAWTFCDWGAPADWVLSTDRPYRGNGSFRVAYEPQKTDPKPFCQFRLPLNLNRAHRLLRFHIRATEWEKDAQWWVQIQEKDNDVWNVGGGKLSELEEGWNTMSLPILANPKLAWKGGNAEYDPDAVQNIYFSLAGAKGVAYTDDWALIEIAPGEK